MAIKVCIAGATGWVGSALAPAVFDSSDFDLVGAVSLEHVNESLGKILDVEGLDVKIQPSVSETLKTPTDVMIDFTSHNAVKQNVLCAIENKVNVVIGTSGLTDSDYEDIEKAAIHHNVSVLAAGNFCITAVLMMHFAEIAAKHVPHWEIIDYASASKKDAPSGTIRELTYLLSNIREPVLDHSVEETIGPKETRGARVNDSQVHAIRVPGFIVGGEIIFGFPDQRLSIRHDAGSSPEPYIEGILLAVRKVDSVTGLVRGLSNVMDL